MSTHIRWMVRRDLCRVLEIERNSFETPWKEEDFIRWLGQSACIGMVAVRGDIYGFVIYELNKSSLHIHNFAVHPHHRRKGMGSDMVRKLVAKLSSHRRGRITLDVRESNLAGQLFFRSHGFLAEKVIRGFYEDTCEDCYRMAFTLPEFVADLTEEENISHR